MHDFIIVGAGIVGPALARGLAMRGKSVLLLERDLSEPDRIVGELLQPGGVEHLRKLGMEEALNGIDAAPIYGYEVIYEGQRVNIPYPSLEHEKEPAAGRGFHHGRFVMNLRRLAAATDGVTLQQATVTNILVENDRVTGVETKEHGDLRAKIVCVCDGTSSKFRKQFVQTKPTVESYFVGAVLKNPQMPAPNHGNVIIGSDFSPILVYQTSAKEARILCDFPGPKLPSASNGDLKRWLEVNALPKLPAGLQISFKEALEKDRLRTMPNQYLPAVTYDVPGLVLLGDALNMRHPLTGGGMTVGLGDAVILSRRLGSLDSQSLEDHNVVRSELTQFRSERKLSSVVVNVLSIALYQLFAAQSPELRILQNGCFQYFQRGGECVNGPVGLLSGLLSKPSLLFYHFFAVAFYAIYLNYAEKWAQHGPIGIPMAFYQMFSTLWVASVVFVPFLVRELLL